MPLVSTDLQDEVATLTMHHGRRLNALGEQLITDLLGAIDECTAARARAAVLRAEPGVTTWSAGHDVAELPTDGRDPLAWSNPLERLLRAVRLAPFPVVAAVEGGVWGGACDLVVSCDLVVAVRTSTFAITPAKLGVPYNTVGVSHFLGALPLHLVKEMFFTADPISAEQAAQYGLVNRLVGDESEMTSAAAALAARCAERAPLVVAAAKAELTALTDASPMTAEQFERLTAVRRAAWRSGDYQEGLAAFHERRPPHFEGN